MGFGGGVDGPISLKEPASFTFKDHQVRPASHLSPPLAAAADWATRRMLFFFF